MYGYWHVAPAVNDPPSANTLVPSALLNELRPVTNTAGSPARPGRWNVLVNRRHMNTSLPAPPGVGSQLPSIRFIVFAFVVGQAPGFTVPPIVAAKHVVLLAGSELTPAIKVIACSGAAPSGFLIRFPVMTTSAFA
jgi:hypothetical protein